MERLRIWSELLAPAWRWILLTPFGLVSALQAVRDELLSPADAEKYKLPGFIPAWPWQDYALITLALGLLVVLESAFRSIKKREAETAKVASTLEQEQNASSPKLALEIDHVTWGGEFVGRPGEVVVLPIVSVSNTGAPSICRTWKMFIERDGVEVPVRMEHIAGQITALNKQGQPMFFAEADFIYNKTLTPLPTGSLVRGHMIGGVPAALFAGEPRSLVLRVKCKDVNMMSCEATRNLNDEGATSPKYVPGMSTSWNGS